MNDEHMTDRGMYDRLGDNIRLDEPVLKNYLAGTGFRIAESGQFESMPGVEGFLWYRGVVENPLGMHARPSARVVQAYSEYRAEVGDKKVWIHNPNGDVNWANAYSIMNLLTLGACQGTELDFLYELPFEDVEKSIGVIDPLQRRIMEILKEK